MRRTLLALAVAGLLGGALFGLSGCYATSATVGVGVEAGAPPAVAYYDGYRDGYAWIDGHWIWTAYGWQWYPGYWATARPGYVYIQGYWDYGASRWFYRPGSWARWRNGHVWVGSRWRPYRAGYHHYDYRRGTWVRGNNRGYRAPMRDYRGYRGSNRDTGGQYRSNNPPSRRSSGRSGGTYRRRR